MTREELDRIRYIVENCCYAYSDKRYGLFYPDIAIYSAKTRLWSCPLPPEEISNRLEEQFGPFVEYETEDFIFLPRSETEGKGSLVEELPTGKDMGEFPLQEKIFTNEKTQQKISR